MKSFSYFPFYFRRPRSIMDAIILGISQSVAVVVQAIAFIMTFVIILSFVNKTLIWFGERVGVQNMTIEVLFVLLSSLNPHQHRKTSYGDFFRFSLVEEDHKCPLCALFHARTRLEPPTFH